MTCEELQISRKVFGLGTRATLKEIKLRHRALVKQYHPDTGGEHNPEKIRKVNTAYKVLLAYIESFYFAFSEEEFYRQNPEERTRQQFKDDPLWGKGA